jgi:uncharacterized protein
MEEILEQLNNIPGIVGSMIIGKDGLVIATMWNEDIDPDMVGAHTADLLNITESITTGKLDFGLTEMITVEAENAKLLLKIIDDSTFLITATTSRANLGLMRIEIKSAAKKLRDLL